VADDFRALVQTFIRQFGLLAADRTPCGRPLATSDAHALMLLRGAGEDGVPQAVLAVSLGIDKSTASRLVARLIESGHLAVATATDGRVRPVRLTKKGLRLADEVDQSSQARFAALLEALPAARRTQIVQSFRDVNEALGRLKQTQDDEEP
jgi:DNA-binding MarR family transcriptional regulator